MFHAGPDGPEWWVTVFGFPPSLPEPELKAILRDFQARITRPCKPFHTRSTH